MSAPPEVAEAIRRAQALQSRGQLAEAERTYRDLAATAGYRETALQLLADLYEQGGRKAAAVDTLVELTGAVPDRLYYYARLANVLEALGRADEAIDHYLRFLRRQPDSANAHFNLALIYRKNKRYAEAIASYEEALGLGIEGEEEVYSNLGVLYAEMRRTADARRMYERSLERVPDYIPALFNLAGLLEETGERGQAVELYERILSLDPGHDEALARIAQARRFGDADEPLLDSLRRAADAVGGDPIGREALYFALGKALDDLGRYEEAFAAYRSANELGRLRNPPYDRHAVELAFDRLIEPFSSEWVKRHATAVEEAPVFICGMFRSGSTLVEQILGSHPALTVGGELDFFPWLVERHLLPFPTRAVSADTSDLESIGRRYLELVGSIFPGASRVTDKRPDNFLWLGVIKAVFPAARIVYTRRHPLDNCLSLYFQQFGGNLNYATDLASTAHYYRQHARLMTHWLGILGEDIFTVDYDELVRTPEPVVRRLLSFLDLEWDDRCLAFPQSSAPVKTASVWQVRETLHDRSSGRWRAYESYLAEAQAILGPEAQT